MNRLTIHFVIASLLHCAATFIVLHTFAPGKHAFSQDLDEATISGRVLDQNGAALPGANVTTILTATDAGRTVVADEEGRYRLIELKPGTYTVRVAMEDFATEEKENLTIVAGQNVRLDFKLRLADVVATQTVVSEAETPLVDTTRTIVGGTLTAREIEALPNAGRAPLDLVFTLGGVTEEPLSTRDLAEDRGTNVRDTTPEEAGAFALSGGPAYSNNITIDGLDNNDDRAARERFQPSLEAVEEVQVITNQFSAEYGRASGGRVNLRTRGGASDFRGRVFYFFRDESLNSNTFRNNLLGLKRLPLQEHNPGFTLSGPLVAPRKLFGPLGYDGRGRTFFFAALEYDTLLDTTLIDTLVPVAQNDLFPLPVPTASAARRTEDAPAPSRRIEIAPFVQTINTPLRNSIFTARVDHKFSEVHNGTFLYQLGRYSNLRQFGGGNRLADSLQGKRRDTDAVSYSDNYVFSAHAVNQARVQFSQLSPATRTGGDAAAAASPVVLISINDSLADDNSEMRSGTLVAGSSTAGASARRESRFQFQDTLSLVRGAHALKFGGDIQRVRSTFIDLSDVSGTFSFASAGDFLMNVPSRFRQNFQTESAQRNVYSGFFAHCEWRVLSNLTVSYGLRYENESILRDRNNWGPRFAVSYDPFGSGKTVVRAGYGVFYNRPLLRTIDDFTLGKQQLFFDTNALRDPVTGKLLTAEERRVFIASNLTFPRTLSPDSLLVKQFGALNTNFSRRLDPDLRIPESYQANLGFEREVGGGFVVEANYAWNRGVHLWREFNVNAPALPGGFKDFTEYLLSRDFENFRRGVAGTRPLYNAAGAGELVRFTLAPFDPTDPARCRAPFSLTNADALGCVAEFGIPLTIVNLNSFSSSTTIGAALAAVNDLRPDPSRGEVEQLASVGNSFYHGLTMELRRRFGGSENGLQFSFRAAYTVSSLIDDGIVNTSDALVAGDFRRERARSLLDRRHRFVFSGTFDAPRSLGRLRLSPVLRIASGAPFNISIGGADRNLDDVGNDRPDFTGDVRWLRARRPGGAALDPTLLDHFRLPAIGRAGNLPRNAGTGPGLFQLDLSVTREFRFGERMRMRPVIEVDNVLNKTVFSFGTEFINFNALGPAAGPAQREAFTDSFLVTTRTLRHRAVRLGMRFDF